MCVCVYVCKIQNTLLKQMYNKVLNKAILKKKKHAEQANTIGVSTARSLRVAGLFSNSMPQYTALLHLKNEKNKTNENYR